MLNLFLVLWYTTENGNSGAGESPKPYDSGEQDSHVSFIGSKPLSSRRTVE